MAAAAALSTLAIAQTDDVARITDAYQNLRAFPGIDVQVTGTQTLAGGSTDLSSTIEWPWDETATTPQQKMSAREYRNGSEVARTVGDGTTLWSLNELKNEYVAHNYGSYSGAEPTQYRLDLLQHFNWGSRLPANYAARLLREVYGDGSPVFRSWAPRATVTVLVDGQPAQQDPITKRTYDPTPTRDYVMYEVAGDTNRSVVFERDQATMPDGSQQWILGNVYIAESSGSGAEAKKLDVILGVTALNTTPPDADFGFTPPTGAKVLQGSELNGH